MSEHIVKRGGRYYYRRRVPTDLIEKYGKKEHTQALGTADRREAEVLARQAGVRLDAIFASLRRVYTGDRPKPGAQQHMLEEEHGDPAWNPGAEEARDERIEEMKAAIRAVLDGQPAPVYALPAQVPTLPLPAPKQAAIKAATTLADALQAWQKLRAPGPASVDRAQLCAARFHEVCGAVPLRVMRAEHGKAFVDGLLGLGLARGTVVAMLKVFKAVLSAAVDDGLLADNPLRNVKVPAVAGKVAKKARVPFALSDMAVILENLKTREGHRRWIPLVGIYTGMRLEEIGQLAPGDIREESYRDAGGVTRKAHVIYVTEDGEGQGIKNSSSMRRIPIHPELIRLGFLDVVRAATGNRVFSELRPDKNGRESGTFSGWFGRTFLRRTCGITDPRKTFHSFRHLFKDVMRDAGVHEQVSDALTGHTTGSESRKYGDDFYPMRPLVEAIAKFELHGL